MKRIFRFEAQDVVYIYADDVAEAYSIYSSHYCVKIADAKELCEVAEIPNEKWNDYTIMGDEFANGEEREEADHDVTFKEWVDENSNISQLIEPHLAIYEMW